MQIGQNKPAFGYVAANCEKPEYYPRFKQITNNAQKMTEQKGTVMLFTKSADGERTGAFFMSATPEQENAIQEDFNKTNIQSGITANENLARRRFYRGFDLEVPILPYND